eukprot:6186344-Pleurochrysis_carterae.AAC.1
MSLTETYVYQECASLPPLPPMPTPDYTTMRQEVWQIPFRGSITRSLAACPVHGVIYARAAVLRCECAKPLKGLGEV